MKKILSLFLTMIVILSCITACSNGANRFYKGKALKEFQITDFPKPQGAEYVSASDSSLNFNTTAEDFEDYAEQIYTYLVKKDFKYFGYRGDVISTFFGGVPNYEFYISSEFSEHQYLVNGNVNCYVFVFSDELSKNDCLLNECAIVVKYLPDNEKYNAYVSIQYDKNVFTGYTLITNKDAIE